MQLDYCPQLTAFQFYRSTYNWYVTFFRCSIDIASSAWPVNFVFRSPNIFSFCFLVVYRCFEGWGKKTRRLWVTCFVWTLTVMRRPWFSPRIGTKWSLGRVLLWLGRTTGIDWHQPWQLRGLETITASFIRRASTEAHISSCDWQDNWKDVVDWANRRILFEPGTRVAVLLNCTLTFHHCTPPLIYYGQTVSSFHIFIKKLLFVC